MIQTVVKRDGRIVGYNEEKVKAAIRKAMLQTEKGEDESLIMRIVDRITARGRENMEVEQIQDMVEDELMKSSRKEVARKYIAYRDQRRIARNAKTRDVFLEIINAKNNDVTRENANMNADSPAGMIMKFASETTKKFVDDYLARVERGGAWQLSARARQGLLSHQEPHLRAAPARQHSEIWLYSRSRRIASCQAHRNGKRDCLHIA